MKEHFREFEKNRRHCKFQDCCHINEPGCKIKKLVEEGEIPESRYNSYLQIYNELKERERS
ncbi:hypothetical protein HMPREF9129_1232 [Peptoniphilus indolicus ATCC 29427]|uniref:Ribosome biogenesis GTPase RsgA n=1 Tax=Peptoniphilus indolicus ATCC 29427 TaxID=997350 RepID=G4D4A2_9FIRM|nr:hypothetical protein [Peptoniphilus indolicus]EGY79650.1 hypothetical protein HMPREF9129_1232 [Peptoniphilus indolicus ATCC 29427]